MIRKEKDTQVRDNKKKQLFYAFKLPWHFAKNWIYSGSRGLLRRLNSGKWKLCFCSLYVRYIECCVFFRICQKPMGMNATIWVDVGWYGFITFRKPITQHFDPYGCIRTHGFSTNPKKPEGIKLAQFFTHFSMNPKTLN